MDDHGTVFHLPGRAHFQRAASGPVHGINVCPGRDDLGLGGKIRPLYKVAQILQARPWRLQQPYRRLYHLPQVVGGNISGHTHCDPGGAVEQQIRDLGR